MSFRMRSTRFATGAGLVRLLCALGLVAGLMAALATGASAKKAVEVGMVTQGTCPEAAELTELGATSTKCFHHIQEAVEGTGKGAWVVIAPGVYHEEVKVKGKTHEGLHIRGMDRNTVILDGTGLQNSKGSNGIEIGETHGSKAELADNVTVENLTVRNFEQEPEGPGGNAIWWSGGDETGKVGGHGWWGRYLTAYDSGLYGSYGIFTNNMIEGEWENIYASGYDDSGMYLGACQECQARIIHPVMEYNQLGYSGSNSGGSLAIEDGIFRHNSSGVAPNGENPGDPPPPQDGQCNHDPKNLPPKKKSKKEGGGIVLPEFTTTKLARCTVIRHNLITENNNNTTPATGSAEGAPFGAGVELPGDYADLVEENTITNNASDGVLAFEYPNPFPPVPGVTIYLQNSGNKVANNTFSGNGTLGLAPAFEGDIAFEGGVFAAKKSVDNCFSGNTTPDTTYPANLEGEWGCQNNTTPNPGGGEPFINYLLALQAYSEARTREPQPTPGVQETMANPCREVPVTPLCP
jgi:hypothetical protein